MTAQSKPAAPDVPLTRIAALVLDAMGVIYSVGDDVADLLCPFIEERGGESDRSRIELLDDF